MDLPNNPNVRQPYSDVYEELDYYMGQAVMLLGISRDAMGEYEWKRLEWKLKALDQAMLRVRAVLDPLSLTGEDWMKTDKTAFTVMTELETKGDK